MKEHVVYKDVEIILEGDEDTIKAILRFVNNLMRLKTNSGG